MTDLATLEVPVWMQGQTALAIPGYEGEDEFGEGIPVGGGLPYLSIRGRAFRINKDDEETILKHGDATLNAINAVILAARPAKSKRYYSEAYDTETGSTEATCRSTDGKNPDPEIQSPVSPTCVGCPFDAFKSADNGRGKKCGDVKRLVLAFAMPDGKLARDKDGELAVCKIDVPGASLPSFRTHNNELKRAGLKMPFVVSRIEFVDAEFPQLAFSYVGLIDQAELATIAELRQDPTVQADIALTRQAVAQPLMPTPANNALPPTTTTTSAPTPPAEDRVPDPTPAAPAPASEPEADEDDLDDMNLDQLKAKAAELGIEVPEGKRSPTYRKMIREHQGTPAPTPAPVADAAPEAPAGGTDSDIADIMSAWD